MLIDSLKKDHIEIIDMLTQVKAAGIGSKAGKEKLFAAKQILLNHLQKEDTSLYPFLEKEAKNNSNLQETLGVFIKEMESISQKAMNFFDKYSTESNTIEFARDFGALVSTLSARIRQEEKILYLEYEKRIANVEKNNL